MTELEYNAGIEMISRRDPDNPLLPDLKKGQSKINEIYMKKVIKKIEAKKAEKAEKTPDDTDDLILKNMQSKRRSLYGQRAKLSNAFHKMRTNKDRAYNSEKIQIVQHQIEDIERKIRHYKQSGAEPQGPFSHLPDDDFKLFHLKENARKNVPRIEKALEKLFAQPEKTPGRAKKIAKKEKKLAEHKRLIEYVEKRLSKEDI